MTTLTSQDRSSTGLAAPSWVQRHPLLAYFAIAFAGTWIVFAPIMLSAGFNLFPLADGASFLLFFLSAYTGPALAALLVTRATEGAAGVRRLLRRIVQWRVGLRWYLAALFTMLLIWLAAYSIIFQGIPLRELLANPQLMVSLFLPNVLMGIFIPSLGEEVGWRGFALPRLQGQYGPLLGTLVLGVLHGLWHLPALFTPMLGPFSGEVFVTFVLTAIGGTFIYTWIVNNARGSILIAVLLHAASNAGSALVGQLVPQNVVPPAPIQALLPGWFNVILFGLAAVLLVVFTRGRLGYQPEAGRS